LSEVRENPHVISSHRINGRIARTRQASFLPERYYKGLTSLSYRQTSHVIILYTRIYGNLIHTNYYFPICIYLSRLIQKKMPHCLLSDPMSDRVSCLLESLEKWIRTILEAEFSVTIAAIYRASPSPIFYRVPQQIATKLLLSVRAFYIYIRFRT
jgi:hypothetical protein